MDMIGKDVSICMKGGAGHNDDNGAGGIDGVSADASPLFNSMLPLPQCLPI